jgi:hypothetical protein
MRRVHEMLFRLEEWFRTAHFRGGMSYAVSLDTFLQSRVTTLKQRGLQPQWLREPHRTVSRLDTQFSAETKTWSMFAGSVDAGHARAGVRPSRRGVNP